MCACVNVTHTHLYMRVDYKIATIAVSGRRIGLSKQLSMRAYHRIYSGIYIDRHARPVSWAVCVAKLGTSRRGSECDS